MNTLATRRILGGFTAQTARARTLDVLARAATDRNLTSTRARVVFAAEQLKTIDPALAEAFAQLLPNSADAELPALLPAFLRPQVF